MAKEGGQVCGAHFCYSDRTINNNRLVKKIQFVKLNSVYKFLSRVFTGLHIYKTFFSYPLSNTCAK
jgi:hypothetical protein